MSSAKPQPMKEQITRKYWQLAAMGVLVCLLLAIPRARMVIGAPLYLIDLFAAIILVSPIARAEYRWVPRSPITAIVTLYFALVLVSELIGMLAYGTFFESTYMMGRFSLAMAMFFILPRLVLSEADLKPILKGLVLGVIIAGTISTLYSLGPTRSLVLTYVFSIEAINPGWRRIVEQSLIFGAGEAAMRGRSLVGAATLTAGFLGLAWPLTFIAYQTLKSSPRWKLLSRAAMIIGPIAILMTYGRTAWLMVTVVGLLIVVFNMGNMRRTVISVGLVLALIFTVFQIDSSLFLMDRIFKATNIALENPTEDESVGERVLSFVEPFEYLVDNPSWLLVGVGRAGSKATTRGVIEEQLYDEGTLATHSGFAMSFYSFGFIASICQILMIVISFFMIRRRIRISKKAPADKILWQSLLMSWCCMVIWWLSGHGMVGEPRGVMLLFTFYGLIMAFEKLAKINYMNRIRLLRESHASHRRPVAV